MIVLWYHPLGNGIKILLWTRSIATPEVWGRQPSLFCRRRRKAPLWRWRHSHETESSETSVPNPQPFLRGCVPAHNQKLPMFVFVAVLYADSLLPFPALTSKNLKMVRIFLTNFEPSVTMASPSSAQKCDSQHRSPKPDPWLAKASPQCPSNSSYSLPTKSSLICSKFSSESEWEG